MAWLGSSAKGYALGEDQAAFPMDIYDRDAAPARPWQFRPQGYLVVIFNDEQTAEVAGAALVDAGFASTDMKRYASEEILANFEAYRARRTTSDKVVGSFRDDAEGRDLYVGYARDGNCALWLRISDEGRVPRALRVLADFPYRHLRHYGENTETDFKL